MNGWVKIEMNIYDFGPVGSLITFALGSMRLDGVVWTLSCQKKKVDLLVKFSRIAAE